MSTVTANLSYFVQPKDGSKPYQAVVEGPNNEQRLERNYTLEQRAVEIENVRGKEREYTLDKNGFQFYKVPSKHEDFTDDDAIREEYYPESVELIKKLTGASQVVLFDHTVRRRVPDKDGDWRSAGSTTRQPATTVHVDQSTGAAITRVHRHLPPVDAEAALRRRFQIINLWRPVRHAALDWPLAFCDFTSVNAEEGGDVVPTDLRNTTYVGETMSVRYNPGHRWKYLKGMEPDEFVLIKCFDSKDGVAKFTPHTAFQDPSTPSHAPFRESIELRALVFYD
ncbi:hypothetical protein OE88DRAFT_1681015 [Heliocybe sulcata]|uniref:Methyltransferase n=1 Tax=Heliocybe sulcata TaxID=5364 RepID=A0A5C3N1K4_9AGAM|nr:hypothetical protein OE88DRAFT_1681015 [Heliocybe sulcata]